MANIKQSKFKEALFDCDQALYINPAFAKAHLRAFTCNLAQGFLEKAKESLQKALDLGDTTMANQVAVVDELMKYEGFAKAALKRKDSREAVYYATKLCD